MRNFNFKRLISTVLAAALALALLLAWPLAGEVRAADDAPVLQPQDFIGKTFVVVSGTIFDQEFLEKVGDAEFVYVDSTPEVISMLKDGKVDAAMLDEPVARKLFAQDSEITLISPLVSEDEYGFAFPQEHSELRTAFNEFLAEIRADGAYDDIVGRWLDTAVSPLLPDIPLTGTQGTLKFATTKVDEPFSYEQNGKIAGFDVELALRFAQHLGMKLEFQFLDFSELIPAVQSGKADFAAGVFSITAERAELVAFSEPYYLGGAVIVINTPDTPSAITIDGVATAANTFAFEGKTFISLRSAAAILSGTANQFNVEWDDSARVIKLTSSAPYASDGGKTSVAGMFTPNAVPVYLDGEPVSVQLYEMGGYNYISLDELASLLGLHISLTDGGYDIDTSQRI